MAGLERGTLDVAIVTGEPGIFATRFAARTDTVIDDSLAQRGRRPGLLVIMLLALLAFLPTAGLGEGLHRVDAVHRQLDFAGRQQRQQVARRGFDALQPLLLAAGAERHADQLEALEPEFGQVDAAHGAGHAADVDQPTLDGEHAQVGFEDLATE